DRHEIPATETGLTNELRRYERIVGFRQVALACAAEVSCIALRIEEARRFAFDDDWSYGAAGGGIWLWAVAAVIAASAAELLIVVLILSLMLLLLLRWLLLVAAALGVSIAVSEAAKPSTSLSATLVAAVLVATGSVCLDTAA